VAKAAGKSIKTICNICKDCVKAHKSQREVSKPLKPWEQGSRIQVTKALKKSSF
jgi:hypothetical protein